LSHGLVLLGDGEVGSLLGLVLHGLHHGLPLTLGFFQTLSLLVDFLLFLLLSLADTTFLLFLLPQGQFLLLISAGDLVKVWSGQESGSKVMFYLALGLFVLQLFEVILLLGSLFAPLSDVLLELLIEVGALLLLVL
jgi:hypothetical protein